jgi:ketosteroid isomerase-like protein
MMKRFVVAGVAWVGLAVPLMGLAQSGGKTDPRVTKLAKQWEAAYNAKDPAKVAMQYAEDGIVNPPNQSAVRGRAAIQNWAKETMGVFTSITLTPAESAISGNIGYEAGTYSGTMASGSDKGKYVVVLKRVGAQWLIAHDIFNSDMPPPPPPSN